MQLEFTTDLRSRLEALAEQQGRNSESLVVEAVERLVNHDEWFVAEVEKGLAQVEAGRTLSHADVDASIGALLGSRTPEPDGAALDRRKPRAILNA